MASSVNEKDLLLAGYEDFLSSLPHDDLSIPHTNDKQDPRDVFRKKCGIKSNSDFVAFVRNALRAVYEKCRNEKTH